MTTRELHSATTIGEYHGRCSGLSAIDVNAPYTYRQTVLDGYSNGDPAVYAIEPDPLSGEWAGCSLKEMSAMTGLDLYDPEVAEAFEKGFSAGFWYEVLRALSATLGA
jgi:hypothetical protein